MRSLERIVLYVVTGVVAVSLLDRAVAQDPPAPEQQQVMTVPALEIQNDKGVTVIRLSAAADGAGQVEVFSKDGKKAARLFAHAKGGMLITHTGAGQTAALVGSETGETGGGYFAMFGATGNKVMEAYTHAKGGLLSLMNAASKKSVVSIGAATDTGAGLLGLSNSDGVRGILSYGTKDGGLFKVLNAQGKTVAHSGVASGGTGYFYAARADGAKIVEVGRNTHLGGYLAILNGLGKRVAYLGASTHQPQGDGVLEISRNNGNVGVVLRAIMSGSYVQVHDAEGKAKNSLR